MPDYTILVVDYEPRVVEIIRRALEGGGYHVESAANGNAGVVAFERLNPDLTLISAMLPRRQGLEVCRELKATTYGETAPVLILASRFQGRRIVGEARRSGAAGCVFKPIVEQELLDVVREHLPSQATTADPEPAAVGASGCEITERLDALLSTDVTGSSKAAPVTPGGAHDREPPA